MRDSPSPVGEDAINIRVTHFPAEHFTPKKRRIADDEVNGGPLGFAVVANDCVYQADVFGQGRKMGSAGKPKPLARIHCNQPIQTVICARSWA
jgi:hypothetical protein